ncbi:MAG: lysylphosphatidylglycerol synthase transmembrane domain-containing protein [bacterium]
MTKTTGKKTWFRKNWKIIVNLVTLIALGVLIYAIRDQLGATLSNLKHVNAWFLLLLIPIEFLNYHAQAKMYQKLYKLVGNKLSYKFLLRTSLELNFVNHVFPSGGVTGFSYYSLRMRSGDELTGTKATLVHTFKLALMFLSFEILLVFGLFSLAIMGKASNLTILVAAVVSTLVIVGTIIGAYILGSKHRINSFFTAITKGLNRIIQIVRPKHPETININKAKIAFTDFHENYQIIKQSPEKLKSPFLYALLANITEVLAIYVVYLAFGEAVNIGAVILAYAVANFAGLVSVLPGGVGIYEALMTAVMATAGVPAALSLPVTVMYRVLNTAIQLPLGYYYYHQNLVSNQKDSA